MSIEPFIFHDRDDFQMIFAEPGSDTHEDFIFNFGTFIYQGLYSSVPNDSSLISSSTFDPHTGPRSIKLSTVQGVGNTAQLVTNDFGITDGITSGGRVSFYFKLDVLPNSNNTKIGPRILTLDRISASATAYAFRINTSGKVDIMTFDDSASDFIVEATSTQTVSLNVWQRFTVCWRIPSVSGGSGNQFINECRVYLDGNAIVAVSNIDLRHAPQIGRLAYGLSGSWQSGVNMYVDDLYVDNNDTMKDTGNVRVTAKRPASNYTNNFATNIGNNPSNRWENVNERPISYANGWEENSGGPYPIDENYGIETASQGDFDLSSYSGGYPSFNPGIGLRTSYSGGINLWECGMVIAFSDDTNSILGFMPWVFSGTVTGSTSTDVQIWSNGSLYNSITDFTTNTGTVRVNNFAQITIPQRKPIIFSSRQDSLPMIFHDRP